VEKRGVGHAKLAMVKGAADYTVTNPTRHLNGLTALLVDAA
jgi:hypothetical protein